MWNKRRRLSAAAAVLGLALLSGCGGDKDPSDLVILESEETELSYEFGYVRVADIIAKESMRCTYLQVNSEDLAFELSGKQIARVYVKAGDRVKKGDLLAELSSGQLDPQIEELDYQISRNKLLLEHAKTNRDLEIKLKEKEYEGMEQTEANKNRLTRELATIQRRYQTEIANLEDDITIKQRSLDSIEEEKGKSYLYAGMDGKISFVAQYLEGSTSEANKVVMRVIDDSQCYFVAQDMEFKDSFRKDGVYELVISSGEAKGTYSVVPYQMDTWEEKMYFVLEDQTDETSLKVNDTGTLEWLVAEKKQVLSVPSEAVHFADGKAYVYVVGSNRVREARWISIGVSAKDATEVTDGLAEGDMVVLK